MMMMIVMMMIIMMMMIWNEDWFRGEAYTLGLLGITFTFFLLLLLLLFRTVLSQWDFSHRRFGLLSPGKASTQPMVRAGCFRIFNVRTIVNACDCTRGCTDTVRESALKVDSGRKISCRTGESNLRQRRASPMLSQLSYIPALIIAGRIDQIRLRPSLVPAENKKYYVPVSYKERNCMLCHSLVQAVS